MISFILTVVAIVCIATFGLLKNTWAGFVYFALVFACFITLYWSVILIKKYVDKYKKYIQDDFNLYIAKIVNKYNLTLQDIENDKKRYLKKFKRSQWKEKGTEIIKICLCLGIFIACFVMLFTLHN